jgi:hypothetical protein
VCIDFKKIPHSCLNIVADKKARASLGNPAEINSDGFLMDMVVQPVDEDTPTHEDKRRDINQFFHPAVLKDVNGKMKKYSSCKLCLYVQHLLRMFLYKNHFYRNKKSLVDEVTTLRRHLEAAHSVSLLPSASVSYLDISFRGNIANGLRALSMNRNCQAMSKSARQLLML